MRHAAWLWFVVLLVVAGARPTVAEAGINAWTSIGPDGGMVTALVVDPSATGTLYAGTDPSGIFEGGAGGGAVFKSTDGGATWAPTGLVASVEVATMAIDPQSPSTVYAATAAGLFRTTDGGSSWSHVSPSGTAAVALDPSTPGTVYAGGSGGLSRSADGGATWTATALTDWVSAVAIHPTTPAVILAITNVGLQRSTDAGSSWTIVASEPATFFGALAFDPADPSRVFASDDRVYRSMDGGLTWTPTGSPCCNFIRSLVVETGGIVYAGILGDGVTKSTDGGETWSFVVAGLGSDAAVLSLALDPSAGGVVYAGMLTGVYKTTSGGATWTAATTGLRARDTTALAVGPPTSPALWLGSKGGGVLRSTDGGSTWSDLVVFPLNRNVQSIAVHPTAAGTAWAGTVTEVYATDDGGASWTGSLPGTLNNQYVFAVAVDPSAPTIIYAGKEAEGVFKSLDGGATWSATGLANVGVFDLDIDRSAPATIYAGTLFQGVHRTTDGGLTWTPVNTGLPPSVEVLSVTVDPNAPATVYATGFFGIAKTTDGGGSWTILDTGIPASLVWDLVIDPDDSASLFAATRGYGVYRSRTGGASWQPINDGLLNRHVVALAFDPTDSSILYAGTYGNSVFQLDIEVCENDADCDDGDACTLDACAPDDPGAEIDGCLHGVRDCDDGNVCTDELGCDPEAGCLRAVNTAPCDDGLFCNGADVCADGTCTHPGDPCATGPECARTCDEAADDCFAASGAPCTDDGNPCTADACDGGGVCSHLPGNAGASCRLPAGACDLEETCTGTSASCPLDGFQSGGTPCRPATGPCDVADACTGASPDCPPDSVVPDTTPCSDGDACTVGDACSAGVCSVTPVPDSDADGFCDVVDNCAGEANPDQLDSDCGGDPAGDPGCAGGGDVCDPCPALDDDGGCDANRSGGESVGPGGATFATPDGAVTITLPAGAVATDTSISVTQGVNEFLVDNAAAPVIQVGLRPEDQHFLVPVTITVRWDDRDGDGNIDRGVCQGGTDVGSSCDADADCPGSACSRTSEQDELGLVLKHDGMRFSQLGIGLSPFRCQDHLAGSGCEAAAADCSDPPGTGSATVANCCDPLTDSWTFQTCDFSTFLLGTTAADLIPGRGDPRTDCLTEWASDNPQNEPHLDRDALPNFRQTCRDGDTSCDDDGLVNGVCVFRIGVCANAADARLPACAASGLRRWALRKPLPDSADGVQAANAEALRAAMLSLGPGVVEGAHGERIAFDPALAERDLCTDLVRLSVPLRAAPRPRKGKAVVRTRAETPQRSSDADKLVLTCLPPSG
jgi:photosystem II stability/assembly factor-like uncharacterized protein